MKYLLFFTLLLGLCQELSGQKHTKADSVFLFQTRDDSLKTFKNSVFLIDTPNTSILKRKDKFLKSFILFNTPKGCGDIEFDHCDFTEIEFQIPKVNLIMTAPHFTNLKIAPYKDSIDQYSGYIYLDSVEAKRNIEISNIYIAKGVRISGKIGEMLIISGVKGLSSNVEIDLTKLRPFNENKKILLYLNDIPFENIQLDYRYFEIAPAITNDQNIACVTFSKLLNSFKNQGFTENYRLLDIEFQHYKYTRLGSWWNRAWGTIIDFISHIWWNYGYNKELILLWTIGLLCIYSGINFNLFLKLNIQTYPVQTLEYITKPSFYHSFIYTSIVFFSLKLDLSKLNYRNRGLLFWFITIYSTGVVCLAYAINFILKGDQPMV